MEGDEAAGIVRPGYPVGVPPEWLLSRICEEFSCLPSEAARELQQTPPALLYEILQLRAYARAKQTLDHAARPDELPASKSLQLVRDTRDEIIRRRGATAPPGSTDSGQSIRDRVIARQGRRSPHASPSDTSS